MGQESNCEKASDFQSASSDGSRQQRGHGGCLAGKIKIGYPLASGSWILLT